MGRTEQGVPRKSLVSLDLLRGMAALAVFFGHIRGSLFVEFGALPSGQQTLLVKLLFGLSRTGLEAVLVFFVLSGYLVGGQVIGHIREGRFSLANYAVERTTRIFLPLIPACLLTIAVNWLVSGQTPNWPQTLANMAGLNGVLTDTLPGNAPLWTLAYEIWFYILAGAVAYILVARSRTSLALLVIACGVGVFCVLDARYALFWAMGALCTLLPRRGNHGLFAIIGLVLFVLGAVDHQLAETSRSFVNVVFVPIPVAEAMIASGICLIIPFLTEARTDAALEVLRRPALYLSSISYTLYLFHSPLLTALDPVSPKVDSLSWSSIGKSGAEVAVIFVAINVLYLAFEANTSIVRRYVRKRLC